MAIPYPFGLGTIVSASKSRSQVASYGMTEPKRGPAYIQKTGTDVPVFWSVVFRFPKPQAQRFWMWFQLPEYLDKGANSFTLPIKTEFGLVDHECVFLPDSLMNESEEGNVFTYSATIRARELVVPEVYLTLGSFYVEDTLPDENDRMLIDYAMNGVGW